MGKERLTMEATDTKAQEEQHTSKIQIVQAAALVDVSHTQVESSRLIERILEWDQNFENILRLSRADTIRGQALVTGECGGNHSSVRSCLNLLMPVTYCFL